MEITPVEPGQRLVVEGYGAGCFKVAGGEVVGSMLIQAGRFDPWTAASPAEIEAASGPLLDLAGSVDVLLIGTGARLEMLGRDLRRRLREAGLASEVMSTPAACRTYNVLVGDDRRVAAALVAMPPA
ncbi:MAG: Mth938-like domain-containing protein [Pseudomonadota bacterium]